MIAGSKLIRDDTSLPVINAGKTRTEVPFKLFKESSSTCISWLPFPIEDITDWPNRMLYATVSLTPNNITTNVVKLKELVANNSTMGSFEKKAAAKGAPLIQKVVNMTRAVLNGDE